MIKRVLGCSGGAAYPGFRLPPHLHMFCFKFGISQIKKKKKKKKVQPTESPAPPQVKARPSVPGVRHELGAFALRAPEILLSLYPPFEYQNSIEDQKKIKIKK